MLRIGIYDSGAHHNFGGYGQLSREMVKSLTTRHEVTIIGRNIKKTFDDSLYKDLAPKDYDKYFDVVYYISSPREFDLNDNCFNVIYTQNALGDLKPSWPKRLRLFDHIIVPGEFDRKIFGKYFKSVSVCPQLVDNSSFKPVPKWRKEGSSEFTFLFVGTTHYRKGFDLIVRSLSLAAEQLQTPLHLKCLAEPDNIVSYINFFADLNANRSPLLTIDYNLNPKTPPWMNRTYNQCDAFITLSRGEGWCMPAHEALLSGLPAIVPNSTAFKEYLSDLPSVLTVEVDELKFDDIEKVHFNKTLLENYYTPDNYVYESQINDAKEKIIELVSNYDKYKSATKESANAIKESFNHQQFLQVFDDTLEELGVDFSKNGESKPSVPDEASIEEPTIGKQKSLTVLASVKKTNAAKGNLGDMFGYLLMEHFCSQYSLPVKRIGVDDDIEEETFAVVGSIIHLCNNKTKPKDTKGSINIIGCGLIKGDKMANNPNLNYIGVRGPKTKELLPTDTEVLSDPGLLLSKMYQLPENPKKEEVGFIIHSVDREHFFALFPEARKNLINNYASREDFLDQLSRYKYVISSSLHGVIFCHSYNIPVCSIRVTDKITGDNFKYTDYYHSIGHIKFKARQPIDERTDFKQLVIDEWQPTKEKIASVQERQEQVIRHAIETFAIDGTQD